MQHYRLARDLELVLIDAARGLGNRRCLPAGPLREPAERLQDADAVLFNGASADCAEGFAFSLQPSALVNLRSGERRELDHFPAGQRLHAVAGIGNPQRFFNTLLGLNWQPVPHPFADHAQFSAESLAFSPPLPLVMTEKDAVKCRAFAADDWWYLAVEAQPTPAFGAWFDSQLQRCCASPEPFFNFRPSGLKDATMDTKLLDILACPITKGPLKLSADKTELISKGAGLAYPIRDGIPVMLESEARTLTDDERLDK